MNEQLQKQLVDWVGDVVEKGGSFLEQELPLFAHEIVAWHFWSAIFLVCVFAVMAAACWSLTTLGGYWLVKARKGKDKDDKEISFVLTLVTFVLGFVCLFWGCGYWGYEATKAKVAPRVVFLDYVKAIRK